MQRISNPPNNLFIDGNPATGTAGTRVMAAWLNTIQEELAYIVEQAGLTLDSQDNTQVLEAIKVAAATSKTPIEGGIISMSSGDAAHDTDIAASKCWDDAGAVWMDCPAVTGARIDAAWAAGDNAGKLDAGAVAGNTLYYTWRIAKAGGTKEALISTSKTAPTMPTGYTIKRRLPAVLFTDSAGDIKPYYMTPNRIIRFLQASKMTLVSGITLTSWSVAQDLSSLLPSGMYDWIQPGVQSVGAAGEVRLSLDGINTYGFLYAQHTYTGDAQTCAWASTNNSPEGGGILPLKNDQIYVCKAGGATSISLLLRAIKMTNA